MPRMINRQMPPPTGEGWVYYDPISRWKSAPWQSFDQLAQALSDYRNAHKTAYDRAGIATDFTSCQAAIDEYNANLCMRMGWKHLVSPGQADPGAGDPKAPARLTAGVQKLVAAAASVAKLAKGYKSLRDWQASLDPPVPQEMADRRAAVCVECPLNKPGNFTDFFTIPLAERIKKDIEEANQRGLKTQFDEKLFVCEACLCPLRLKIFAPIQYILPNVDQELYDRLHPKCWIRDEKQRFDQ